jgi:DNA-binding CsgD family transcriptional regulator
MTAATASRWTSAELRHGYLLEDLQQIARTAAHTAWAKSSDFDDRFEAAWSGVVDHLYSAREAPSRHDLMRAGWDAVGRYVAGELHHHGRPRDGSFHATGTRFQAFWWSQSEPTPSPEGRVVERTALAQILPRLTPRQREALFALAAHDDYALAAQALGMSYRSFYTQIWNARRRFLELWHEGEEPSHLWVADHRKRRMGADGEPIEHRPVTVRHRAARRVSPRPTRKEIPHGLRRYQVDKCRCVICCAAKREDGRKAARRKGVPERQRAITDGQLAQARDLIAAGRSVRSLAREMGVNEATLRWNLRNRRAPDPMTRGASPRDRAVTP